jgi:hypothetical protein
MSNLILKPTFASENKLVDQENLPIPLEIKGRPKKGHLLWLFAENLEPTCFNLFNLLI